MTEFTRPATWDDVFTIVQHLRNAGAEFALVGGYAIAAHGFNRFSEDVDILVNPTDDNATRWVAALSLLPDGALKSLASEPNVFADEQRYALRVNDEITVDVMPAIAGYSWAEMKPYIEIKTIAGHAIPLLNLQGLLKTKQGLRPKDQLDAIVLQAAIERLNPKND